MTRLEEHMDAMCTEWLKQHPRKLDGKYSIVGNDIVNTVSGEIIPRDEPLFLLRARDRNAGDTLLSYLNICALDGCNELHLAGIKQATMQFYKFAREHPERMKQPGFTRHLKLEDTK